MKAPTRGIMALCAAMLLFLPALAGAEAGISLGQAIAFALKNNPDIGIKTYSVAIARGRLKSAISPTDFSIGSSATYGQSVNPIDKNDTANNYSTYGNPYGSLIADSSANGTVSTGVWAEKLFLFGLSAKLSLLASRDSSKVHISDGTVPDYYRYLTDPEARNLGGADLELSLPLLKAFDDSLTAKNVEAARCYLDQQELELEDAISKVILSVSDAYWAYSMDYLQYKNSTESNVRLEERRKNLAALVDAGVASGTEMAWMMASIAKSKMDLILAKNSQADSLTKLEQLMGKNLEESNLAALPSDVFPDGLDDISKWRLPELFTDAYIRGAVSGRADVRSVERQLRIAELQMRIEKINARPDLKLSMSLGYRGTRYGDSANGFAQAFGENIHGLNYSLGLVFNFDPSKNKYGSFDSSKAQYDQAKLQLDAKKRDCYTETKQAARNIANYYDALAQSFEVVRLLKTLIKNEQKIFGSGLARVDKLYDLEEQYESAISQYHGRFRAYLMTALLLKYYEGTLVGIVDGAGNDFSMEALFGRGGR